MSNKSKLSLVIPCYNEEGTLKDCIESVFKIADENLTLELIIVDDGSSDNSFNIARKLSDNDCRIKVIFQKENQGKGAALAVGFKQATGDFVAVQDADLEYDPFDLKKLLVPLQDGKADVVLGSRFLSADTRRVLYFWHSLGNRFLTLLSNMFTDLNLTDMETCYKVFRREVIQNIEIEEKRFGFEPEIIAKVAQKKLRIYEMGISYYGRTYDDGKKIGASDGFRALYCIFKYNAHNAPTPIQFLIYLFIGGFAALTNISSFALLLCFSISLDFTIISSFLLAAGVNYFLSITLLFKREKSRRFLIALLYLLLILVVGSIDFGITKYLITQNYTPIISKVLAIFAGVIFNFLGRKFLVFRIGK